MINSYEFIYINFSIFCLQDGNLKSRVSQYSQFVQVKYKKKSCICLKYIISYSNII